MIKRKKLLKTLLLEQTLAIEVRKENLKKYLRFYEKRIEEETLDKATARLRGIVLPKFSPGQRWSFPEITPEKTLVLLVLIKGAIEEELSILG